MISENTLTGARKMMNMQKLGTLKQFKLLFKNGSNTGSNPMNTGLRAIHYANIRLGKADFLKNFDLGAPAFMAPAICHCWNSEARGTEPEVFRPRRLIMMLAAAGWNECAV